MVKFSNDCLPFLWTLFYLEPLLHMTTKQNYPGNKFKVKKRCLNGVDLNRKHAWILETLGPSQSLPQLWTVHAHCQSTARTWTSEMFSYCNFGATSWSTLWYFVYYRMFIASLRFLSGIFIVFRLLVATRVLTLVPVFLGTFILPWYSLTVSLLIGFIIDFNCTN